MLSSLALDASSGSVTTSLTSNSRALTTIKQTFSVAIDKSGGFSNIGCVCKICCQLAAVLAIPALLCTQELTSYAARILLTPNRLSRATRKLPRAKRQRSGQAGFQTVSFGTLRSEKRHQKV